jgi:hypothetical protein
MADPIQSFLDECGHGDAYDIPAQSRSICCCGNADCAYLKHNQSALAGLERDVSTAARLGKVCNLHPPTPAMLCFAVEFGELLVLDLTRDVAAFCKISGRHVAANILVAGAVDAT